jgi:anti-sigma B factor antagonist
MTSHNPRDIALERLPSGANPRDGKELKLTLATGRSGNAVVLHCSRRIILHREVQALATIVAEVLPSARRMVVDLAGVDSIDSGGLGELVMIQMWADAAGYTLKFAGHRKSLRHLFEITNLISVFDVHASVAEAMAAMVREEIHSA